MTAPTRPTTRTMPTADAVAVASEMVARHLVAEVGYPVVIHGDVWRVRTVSPVRDGLLVTLGDPDAGRVVYATVLISATGQEVE